MNLTCINYAGEFVDFDEKMVQNAADLEAQRQAQAQQQAVLNKKDAALAQKDRQMQTLEESYNERHNRAERKRLAEEEAEKTKQRAAADRRVAEARQKREDMNDPAYIQIQLEKEKNDLFERQWNIQRRKDKARQNAERKKNESLHRRQEQNRHARGGPGSAQSRTPKERGRQQSLAGAQNSQGNTGSSIQSTTPHYGQLSTRRSTQGGGKKTRVKRRRTKKSRKHKSRKSKKLKSKQHRKKKGSTKKR